MSRYLYFLVDDSDTATVFNDLDILHEELMEEDNLDALRIYRVNVEDYRCPKLEVKVRGIEWD